MPTPASVPTAMSPATCVITKGSAGVTFTSPPAVIDAPGCVAVPAIRPDCSVELTTYTLTDGLTAASPPTPSDAATEVMFSPPGLLGSVLTQILTLPCALI